MAHPNSRYTPAERFEMKVDRSGSCHRWTGAHDPFGYGSFWYQGGPARAHLVALKLAGITVPGGMTVDHVWARGCQHRDCVNVAHLEIVSNHVNILRGNNPTAQNARKTHCINGHLLPEKSGTEWRFCLTCRKAYDAARDRSLDTQRRREREAANPELREARLEKRRARKARAA